MSDTDSKDVRSRSGPVEQLADDERRSLADSMSADGLPRIAIAEALRNHWFEIWYQPKIDLKRKCLAGAEALARIRHPELGVLLPGNFLPEVDEQSVAELVREYRPKSERWPGLIVEVTEDQIVRDIALARDIAGQLQVSGIQIAIDDFGGGYSSLASLRELPFAELKLDRSFVVNCAADGTNAAICQTAIDLAHRFGSAAVAEGVENQADLQALMVMGCDFGQGVLIAPPMPKERFLELLRQRVTKPRGASPKEAMQTGGPVGRVA